MLFCRRGSCPTIILDADEIATAIDAYLVARRVSVTGPRTVRIETPDEHTHEIAVLVDPSGRLIDDEGNVR